MPYLVWLPLFDLQKITANLKIKAANGKELPAVDVFAKSLQYLKFITLAKFEEFDNPGHKILWIITVPAIWSLAAKQIMKEAAHKVGCLHISCRQYYSRILLIYVRISAVWRKILAE